MGKRGLVAVVVWGALAAACQSGDDDGGGVHDGGGPPDASRFALQCASCVADEDCGGGSCVLFPGGGHACALACDVEGDDCPLGFDCAAIVATLPPVCMPAAAGCCVDEDGDGAGNGVDCAAADCDDGAASVHPGAAEACNGVDDDCDPATADGAADPGAGLACDGADDDLCLDGVIACHDGQLACDDATSDLPELCNGVDDDCNPATADGSGDPAAGAPCDGADGDACAEGTSTCFGGLLLCDDDASSTFESCNGVDDDCDGVVDNGNPGGGAACLSGLPGVCSLGTTMCAVSGLVCVPTMAPSAETCDGLDNDCDGVSDDGVSSAEVCDGVDNDCDGVTDDGDPGGGLSCTTGMSGVCSAGVTHCVGGGPFCQPNQPASAEVCDGLDNDCDGAPDDGDPGGNVPCSTGLNGVCAAGTRHCSSGMLSCVENVLPSSESCDGLDNDCNGLADDGLCCVSNDTCATAASYSIGATVNGTTVCAAADSSASCGGGATGADTMYKVTATGDPIIYTFDVVSGTLIDPVLHLHGASACAAADELACNDDVGNATHSRVVTTLPAGQSFLVVDGKGAATGTYTLTSSQAAASNDSCVAPLRIPGNGLYKGTTVGKTDNFQPPAGCTMASSAPDVVYVLTARQNGTITAALCGSALDTVVYVSTTCGSGSFGCNDDSCGLASQLSWPAIAGVTYFIVVDAYQSQSNSFQLSITGM